MMDKTHPFCIKLQTPLTHQSTRTYSDTQLHAALTSLSELSNSAPAPLAAVYEPHKALIVSPQAIILSLHGPHLPCHLFVPISQGLLTQLVCCLTPPSEGTAEQPACNRAAE